MNITKPFSQIGKQLACLAIALLCVTSSAQAAIVVVGNTTVTTGTTFFSPVPGVTTLTFDSISAPTVPPNIIPFADGTISFQPDAKVVNGAVSGQYAAPWNFTTNAADTTNYVTSGSNASPNLNASVTFDFNEGKNYFGLLWGSIDSYNTLKFYDAGGGLVSTVTSGIFSNLAPATGQQDASGTLYVDIDIATAFTKVVMTSSSYAFEFDNVAYISSEQAVGDVPEPASLAIWGLGALGLATIRARRKKLLLG